MNGGPYDAQGVISTLVLLGIALFAAYIVIRLVWMDWFGKR